MWIGREADGRATMTQAEIAHRVHDLIGETPSITSVGRALGDLRKSGHIVHLGETSTASIYGVVDPVAVLKKAVPGVDEPGLLGKVLGYEASATFGGSSIRGVSHPNGSDPALHNLSSPIPDGSAKVERSVPSEASVTNEASKPPDPSRLADPSFPPAPPVLSSDFSESKPKPSSPLTPRKSKSGGGGGKTEWEKAAERVPDDARLTLLRNAGLTDERTIARLAFTNTTEDIQTAIRMAKGERKGPGLIAHHLDTGAAKRRTGERKQRTETAPKPERIEQARETLNAAKAEADARNAALAVIQSATTSQLAEALGSVLARSPGLRRWLDRDKVWPLRAADDPPNPARAVLVAACSHRMTAADVAAQIDAIRSGETRVIPETNAP